MSGVHVAYNRQPLSPRLQARPSVSVPPVWTDAQLMSPDSAQKDRTTGVSLSEPSSQL